MSVRSPVRQPLIPPPDALAHRAALRRVLNRVLAAPCPVHVHATAGQACWTVRQDSSPLASSLAVCGVRVALVTGDAPTAPPMTARPPHHSHLRRPQ